MKNILKKVSAVALAFAMLGTGTVVANEISPKSTNNTIVAEAYSGYTYAYLPYTSQKMYGYFTGGGSVSAYKQYYYGRYTGYLKLVSNATWETSYYYYGFENLQLLR